MNAIVIEAKTRAGRRQKEFHQETGWHKTEYAGLSIISMASAKTFTDKKQSAEDKNLPTKTKSADKKLLLTQPA